MTYTKDEEEFIFNNYQVIKTSEIARVLNRTKGAILTKAGRMGLSGRGVFNYGVDFNLEESLLDPKFLYFLGFVWADGCLTKEKNKFSLSIEIKHTDGEFIKDFFISIAPLRYKLYIRSNGYKVSAFYCRNEKLCAFLGDNDFSKKSMCEPTKILSKIEEKFHIFFWKGFFDGDGSISVNERHRLIAFSGSYDYKWEELCKFFSNLGISIKIRKNIGIYGNNSQATFCKRDWVQKFFELMYPNGYDFGLKRKYDKFILPPLKINCQKRWPRPIWETDGEYAHGKGL